MEKRFVKFMGMMLSVLAVFCMITIMSETAMAADGDTVTIDGIEYTLTESSKTANVTGYTGAGGTVVIPSTISHNSEEYSVVEIGNSAFWACRNITSVVVPEGVMKIGGYAFGYCEAMESISLPDSLTTIEDYAFAICYALTSINIPKNVNSIGDTLFDSCTSLREVIVDEDNIYYISVDGILFNIDKTELIVYPAKKAGTSYEVPHSVTKIRARAFQDSSLTEITLNEELETIEPCAFAGCTALTSIDIPDKITRIEDNTFAGCSSLVNVTLPEGIEYLNGFMECTSLETIKIPNTVTCIGNIAFMGCTSIEVIEIPASVVNISGNAFESCTSLETIVIPNSVTYIGMYAFRNCDSLTSIVIPSNAGTSMYVISECDNLKQIIIAEGATSINEGLITSCPSIENVIIPASVTSIGDDIFNSYNVSSDIVFHYTGTEAQWATLQNSIGNYNDLIVGATPHYISAPVDVDATCTEVGYTDKYVCSTCDEVYYKELHQATDHDYDRTKSESNLTRPVSDEENGGWIDGYYTYTCKNDSRHTITETVKRADYTEYNETYTAYGEAVKNNNLTEAAKTNIKTKVQALIDEYLDGGWIKNNYIESEQYILDNLVEGFKEIIATIEAGVEDGTMIKADYSEAEEYIAKLKEEVSKDIYSDVLKEKVAAIETTLEELKDEKPEASIADVKEELEDIFLKVEELSVIAEKVKAVADKVEALSDTVTLDDAASVEAAKNAYNSLSDYEKSLLGASVKLQLDSAVAKIEELTEEKETATSGEKETTTSGGEDETTTSNQNNEKETTTGNDDGGTGNPPTGDNTGLIGIVSILLISSMIIVAMNNKKIEE